MFFMLKLLHLLFLTELATRDDGIQCLGIAAPFPLQPSLLPAILMPYLADAKDAPILPARPLPSRSKMNSDKYCQVASAKCHIARHPQRLNRPASGGQQTKIG
ncbi:MAG: hypothetical protein JSW39_07690 [Desulfobacterales bacterium]|nr:MAG: hypothetical protein JSW39_07690 [Desulfobacterales bacterium]